MQVKELTGEFFISPQIKVADIAELARMGIKSIICNRPDGEGFWQPSFASISAAAASAGLKVSYLPVSPGAVGEKDVAAFGEIFDALPKPVLGYCASGNRSSALFSLMASRTDSRSQIISFERRQG